MSTSPGTPTNAVPDPVTHVTNPPSASIPANPETGLTAIQRRPWMFLALAFASGAIVAGAGVWFAIRKPSETPTTELVPTMVYDPLIEPMRRLGRGIPDASLQNRADASGYLHGTVHNETHALLEKFKLKIKTKTWERVFEIRVRVEPNTSALFKVFVGGPANVESFQLLGESDL